MLKNKVFVIVVALVLVVSITFNIKVFVERDKNRQLLINHIYFEMENISRDLELFITDQKEGSVEKKLYRLEYASVKLRKLDQTILNYSIYVDELLFYPGIISFDCRYFNVWI